MSLQINALPNKLKFRISLKRSERIKNKQTKNFNKTIYFKKKVQLNKFKKNNKKKKSKTNIFLSFLFL